MKNIGIPLIYLFLTLMVGLGLGYLFFGAKKQNESSLPGPGAAVSEAASEYTCSMHPQIRQAEPGICPLCEMDLTPVESQGGDNNPTVLKMSEEALKLADIQTTQVGRGEVPEKRLRLSGKIMADERRAASQTAHIPGRIEKLYVTFTGERVKQGQALALLYSPPLINAQRELLEALRLKGAGSEIADAARNKLRYWKLSDEFIQKTEQSGQIQKEVLVKADRPGVVMSRKVSVGDYVEEGAPLFELMDLQRVWVLLEAYESDLPLVRMGNRVEITTPAAPGRVFSARITFIDPLLDAQSRTVALRAELDNPEGLFKPEMFVQGEIGVSGPVRGTTLTVPKTAVLWTGKRSVAYVKIPDAAVPSFEFREVELGEAVGDTYQVLSGLEPGEEVVTHGLFSLDAAAQLNNQSSMINRMVNLGKAPAEQIPDLRPLVTRDFASQWTEVLSRYLDLKDALVETNLSSGSRAAGSLLQALNQVQSGSLAPELKSYWQKNAGSLKAHAKNVVEAKSVEVQRRQFFFLSEVLIRDVKAFGAGEQALYLQHCPMAFNNQGGDWVSAQREIRNPYFGDEMLRCGVVKDSFP